MTPQQAAARWQHRQARILARSYVKAWHTGQQAYRTQTVTPLATTAATTPPPTGPAAQQMGRALAPALAGLATMAAQVASVIPTAVLLAENSVEVAYRLAVRGFLLSNAWRLAAGVSVIWAGEQLGYAQAANADGLLLAWELDPRASHCQDCPALAALPPMPLSEWPTLPGEGATACNVGCKCSLQAVAATRPVLTPDQQLVVARVAARQTPVPVAA